MTSANSHAGAVASECQPAKAFDGTRWAAYVLGRHPYLVRVWQKSLEAAACVHMRSDWIFTPNREQFWSSPKKAPWELWEFDDALRELAVARTVDAALLVELHRSWDRVARACTKMARAVRRGDDSLPEDLYWSSRDDWMACQRLTSVLLLPECDLTSWRLFGSQVGEVFYMERESLETKGHLSDKAPVELLLGAAPALVDEWRRLCKLEAESVRIYHARARTDAIFGARELSELPPADQAEICRISKTGASLGDSWRVANELWDGLVRFDIRLRELLTEGQSVTPILVVDELRQTLTVFDKEFSFADFKASNANSGLACYRVLARNPRKSIPAEDLIEKAGLGCGQSQLDSYLSRFRRVVRDGIGTHLAHNFRRLPPNSDHLFVHKAYDRDSKKTTFCLRLDPRLVRYIEPTG